MVEVALRLAELCSFDINDFARETGLGNGLPILFEIFNMELDCFPNKRQYFFPRFTCSNATGQVRHVRAKRGWSLLNHNEIVHNQPTHTLPINPRRGGAHLPCQFAPR